MKNIFIAYVVLVIVLAVIPLGNSTHLEKIIVIHFRADHILHALVFIPWAFFCIKTKKYLPAWFIWGMLYAVCTEGVQYLIPYRSFNVSDMLANVIGLSAGFIIFVSIRKTVLSFK